MEISEFEQQSILPPEDADAIVLRAIEDHRPIARICLFSGGNDSAVLAHRHVQDYDLLAYIDTGTAVPGVLEHVRKFADWLDKPLTVCQADKQAYRLLVLGGVDHKGAQWHPLGFPGPAQHNRAYNRLKQRSLQLLLREIKAGHSRNARVVALSGVRRAESQRRRNRMPINRMGSLIFVNPLIDWSDVKMRRYRVENDLPQSDVAALLHRSGECNCGAFATPGEREMLKGLWPEWFDQTIASLERECVKRGIPEARWGCRPGERSGNVGPLCSDCELPGLEGV